MKLLLIHQAFAGPNDPGGTRHIELARHLVQNGHEFTIIASDVSYMTGQSTGKGDGRLEEYDGVRVLRTQSSQALHKSFFWRVMAFLSFMVKSVLVAKRVQSVDIVMGTSPPIFQALSACLVAALRRRPFVLEVRDLWPEFAVDMGVLTNPVLIRMARLLEMFLYRRATHIIVNSPAYRDYLIEKGVLSRKISFISNGVNPAMFAPEETGQHIRQEFNLGEKFVVTYAGALGLANDIPTILRAADLLRTETGIHFLLVGAGKESAALETMAADMKLDNVTFTGSRPKSDMKHFLAASDVCLATLKNIPMFRTTYPNKVFDYMAAARPTVLGIDGVIRQVIEASNGGIFVEPGDETALANAVLELSRNRDKARAMGRSARQHVVEHFDRQKQAAEFASLLERLAGAR